MKTGTVVMKQIAHMALDESDFIIAAWFLVPYPVSYLSQFTEVPFDTVNANTNVNVDLKCKLSLHSAIMYDAP